MPSHKKARKIVPLEEARKNRQIGKSNRLAIGDLLEALGHIQTPSECESQRKEVFLGLFDVIETARSMLLKGTGAPGIISQAELQTYLELKNGGNGWWQYLRQKLEKQFESGWIVEPGAIEIKWNWQSGFYMIRETPNPSRRIVCGSMVHPPIGGRTASEGETPTAEQLQSWFDLPSDPPYVGGSPTAD